MCVLLGCGDGGVRSFVRSFVRCISDQADGDGDGDDGAGAGAEALDFDVEYRWEGIPEEDEQAGVWLVFATSLVLTIAFAVDTCNGTASGGGSGDRLPSSPSSDRRGFRGGSGAKARRVSSGGGVLRPSGEEERRRRR